MTTEIDGKLSFSKGDIVWVQTGTLHEEPATVLETGCSWLPDDVDEISTHSSSSNVDMSDDDRTRKDGIMVKFNVSNMKQVFPPEKVRPIVTDDDGVGTKNGPSFADKRIKRRSPRTAAGTSTGVALDSKENAVGSSGKNESLKKNKSSKREDNKTNDEQTKTPNAVRKRSAVTPSPDMLTEVEASTVSTANKPESRSGSKRRGETVVTPRKRNKIYSAEEAEHSSATDGGGDGDGGSDDDASDHEAGSSQVSKSIGTRARGCSVAKKQTSKSAKSSESKGNTVIGTKKEPIKSNTETSTSDRSGTSPENEQDTSGVSLIRERDNDEEPAQAQREASNDDDDEDFPYSVGYAPTGRATCRRCDDLIARGAVRISHRPLFRGQRGFTVYRHLRCITFENNVKKAQDVGGWNRLQPDDLRTLKERIVESKRELEEERQELKPDELVQASFSGEIRPVPCGLTASLLPFQFEGFSWMRHQEMNDEAASEGACRGGILADEMGMGKTVQTIAAMCDNRPLLQHCSVGMKHPPDSPDLDARIREESLWKSAMDEWKHEVKMNEIPKGMLSRKSKLAGARAGTLVVCPVIALLQWRSEIEKFTEPGCLSVGIYHGPGRNSTTTADMLRKYDVVLTTYQCLEQDFRKMVSPNKVTCPNCGGKYKIDKLRIHLKYFCGEAAQKTEAQSRQHRSRSTKNGGSGRGGRHGGTGQKGVGSSKKEKKPQTPNKPICGGKRKSFRSSSMSEFDSESELSTSADQGVDSCQRPSRSAAKKANTKVAASLSQWGTKSRRGGHSTDDESSYEGGEHDSNSSDEFSSDDDVPLATVARKKKTGNADKVSSDPVARALEKQRKAFSETKQKKSPGKKAKAGKKGKAKQTKKSAKSAKSESSEAADEADPLADIDMKELTDEAMSGAEFSVLHLFCWWRIVLDEAHYIKTRSSQTAAAAFSLTGIHRWCCSGTPLQNRVGELYSLIRFLRIDPMAHYFCRSKGCSCKSVHYRMKEGICKDCGHRAFTHFSHFNRHILNVIQREGYSGDGRRAMFKLKNEVLDKCLLRRTKETRAEDMNLPPRIVSIRTLRLHPIEEDFYNSLYMQTRASFDDYVAEGTLLNNYAHIFDLLTKMRQAVDHPYLIVYSKNNRIKGLAPPGPAVANGSVDCEICHEPPTDRVLSSCCQSGFCRSCVEEYINGAGGESTPCPSCAAPFSINLNQKSSDVAAEDGNLAYTGPVDSSTVPALKTLSHVQTGSILRRINLAEFATSSKIEVLVQDLIEMREQRPGSKALVFSQFVNMLDLIRWRLHSDPCLAHLGIGVRILHGGMDIKSRDEAIREFREDSSVRVLLMSLKAGGVALNLTVASEVFLVDNWWNPAAEMQAIDRTHRLGQYRPIRATRYICEGTVEERVLQLQEKKRLVFDGTVGRDAGSLKALSVNDMKALFT